MKTTFSIYQLSTPQIDYFAQYSIASILNYARKFGYSYCVLRSKIVDDMHINWSKIEMIRRALETSQSEWVVLFDADMVVMNMKNRLDFFLKKIDNNIHILMSEDTLFFGKNRPNAGFILVRNSHRGKQIISQWLHASRNEGSYLANIHPRNQQVYWTYVMPKYYQNQKLISRMYFSKYQWITQIISYGKFAFHVTQTTVEKRKKSMEKLYFRNHETKTISEIANILRNQKEGFIILYDK